MHGQEAVTQANGAESVYFTFQPWTVPALSKCKRDRVEGDGGRDGGANNEMYANGTIKSHSIFMFFFAGNQKTNDTISLNNSDPSSTSSAPPSPTVGL